MSKHLRMRQPLGMRTAVFVRLVHYSLQAMARDRAAAQAEWYALIHHNFVYEYIYRPRKRHADVIEDFLGLPLFLGIDTRCYCCCHTISPLLCSERTQLYHNRCVLCCRIVLGRPTGIFAPFDMNSSRNDKVGPQFANCGPTACATSPSRAGRTRPACRRA